MVSKVGKLVKFVIFGILFLIIVLGVIFKFKGEALIASAAETAGTNALNVAVNIDDLDIRLLTGGGTINGLSIANPAGFKNPYLMQMQKGEVKVKIKSLLSDEIVVEKIYLDNLHITFEQKGLSSNIQVITDNLKKDEPEEPQPEEQEQEQTSSKKVVISDLQIVNTKLSIKLLPIPGKSDTVTISLPTISMKDIGKGEKMDFADIIEVVFVKISETIATSGSGVIPDDLLGSLDDSLDDAIGALGEAGAGLLDSGSDAGKAVSEKATEAGKSITEGASKTLEGFGNIFGGKKDEDK